MPNHVMNRIAIVGEQTEIDKLLDYIKGKFDDGEESIIDFNKIITMPDSLGTESSSEGQDALQNLVGSGQHGRLNGGYRNSSHYQNMEKMKAETPERFERCIEIGKQYLRNIADYGYSTWYDWRCANWNTKWNAYDQSRDGNTIWFNTAWSAPHPVIKRLSELFPNVKLEHTWSDEDWGCNVGECHYIGGEIKYENIPNGGSKEAYELCFILHPEAKKYYKLEDGNYISIDE